MPVFEELLDAVRQLTPADRMRLVDAMWEDVAPIDWPMPSAEWIAEAQRRSQEFDLGLTSATPWSEVRIHARREAGLDD